MYTYRSKETLVDNMYAKIVLTLIHYIAGYGVILWAQVFEVRAVLVV